VSEKNTTGALFLLFLGTCHVSRFSVNLLRFCESLSKDLKYTNRMCFCKSFI
jgi:hypothetical protein